MDNHRLKTLFAAFVCALGLLMAKCQADWFDFTGCVDEPKAGWAEYGVNPAAVWMANTGGAWGSQDVYGTWRFLYNAGTPEVIIQVYADGNWMQSNSLGAPEFENEFTHYEVQSDPNIPATWLNTEPALTDKTDTEPTARHLRFVELYLGPKALQRFVDDYNAL